MVPMAGRQLDSHLAHDLFLALKATDWGEQANSRPSVQVGDPANSTKPN